MNKNGFTTIELLVTLVIAAILVGVAVPAMRDFSRNQMIVGAITNLSSDLQYARAEAVTRKTDISICASSDGATCSDSSDWLTGWIVSIDDVSECPAADDCIIRSHEGLNNQLSLNASTADPVTFDEQGATSTNVVFALCASDELAAETNRHLRTLTLKPSGTRFVRQGATSCSP